MFAVSFYPKPQARMMRLVGGMVAGGFAASVQLALASILFPSASTEKLIPETAFSQFLWIELNAALLGLILPGVVCPSGNSATVATKAQSHTPTASP